MRRTKPYWKSPSLAVRRQNVNSHATCVSAWERLLLTGRRYLAESPCDALNVLDPARQSRLPADSITLLSTASVRSATVDGPNGRDRGDLLGLVREPWLPRRRNFSANLHRDRVNLKVHIQTEAHSNLRHLQARMHPDLHGPVLSPQKVDQERVVAPKVIHANKHQILVRDRKGVDGRAHSNLRHLQARTQLHQIHLQLGDLSLPKVVVAVPVGNT